MVFGWGALKGCQDYLIVIFPVTVYRPQAS